MRKSITALLLAAACAAPAGAVAPALAQGLPAAVRAPSDTPTRDALRNKLQGVRGDAGEPMSFVGTVPPRPASPSQPGVRDALRPVPTPFSNFPAIGTAPEREPPQKRGALASWFPLLVVGMLAAGAIVLITNNHQNRKRTMSDATTTTDGIGHVPQPTHAQPTYAQTVAADRADAGNAAALEKWRDAALFFAIAASSSYIFSKLGFKLVSACSGNIGRMLMQQGGYDGYWFIRLLMGLCVACVGVYGFRRLAKGAGAELKNSIAGNVGLAFVALALLVGHTEGFYMMFLTAKGCGGTF